MKNLFMIRTILRSIFTFHSHFYVGQSLSLPPVSSMFCKVKDKVKDKLKENLKKLTRSLKKKKTNLPKENLQKLTRSLKKRNVMAKKKNLQQKISKVCQQRIVYVKISMLSIGGAKKIILRKEKKKKTDGWTVGRADPHLCVDASGQ